jgi:hypothetical protein
MGSEEMDIAEGSAHSKMKEETSEAQPSDKK